MYCTSYSMTVKGVKNGKDLDALIEALSADDILEYALCCPYFGSNGKVFLESAGNVSWYAHTEQMIEVSKKFPAMTFRLHGEGESNDDIWNEYFQNGKYECCDAEIVIPKPEKIMWEESQEDGR